MVSRSLSRCIGRFTCLLLLQSAIVVTVLPLTLIPNRCHLRRCDVWWLHIDAPHTWYCRLRTIFRTHFPSDRLGPNLIFLAWRETSPLYTIRIRLPTFRVNTSSPSSL